ncbi:MAG: GAF domain-containing protein [Gammaproteobacteria bacterium]
MFRVPSINSLQHVLEAAVRIDDAMCGLLFLVGSDGESLHVAAQIDAPGPLILHAKTIRASDGSATGQAASERRRVVIRDIADDPALGAHRGAAESAQVRAINATPLIDRDRKIRGVLTTFYDAPHHASKIHLALIDRCCQIAERLIEVVRLHDAMVHTDREMGIPERALSPSAAQAADAARVLLPSISRRPSDEGLLIATERHLAIVADELSSHLRNRSVS